VPAGAGVAAAAALALVALGTQRAGPVIESCIEVGVEQDVGGLDIAVDDKRVGVVECAQHPGGLEHKVEAARPARRAGRGA
jgi:hypothetical protein